LRDWLTSHGIEKENIPSYFPKNEYKANLLHSLAEGITSVMPSGGVQFLNLLQLGTRSPSVTGKIRTLVLHPIIEKMDEAENVRVAEEHGGVLDGEEVIIVFDGAHSAVRNATHTIGVFIINGCEQIAIVKIDSSGSSASREDRAILTGLPELRDKYGYNIVAGGSDQSASGQKIIRNFCGEAICDVWHILKKILDMILKILDLFCFVIMDIIRKYDKSIRSKRNRMIKASDIHHALTTLATVVKAENKFDDIHSKFVAAGYGMSKWVEVTCLLQLMY
jgi:hypothetical protein